MRATQERFTIGQVQANGTIFYGQGSRSHMFPVGDPIANSPEYGSPTGPLACPTGYVQTLLDRASGRYGDKTKIDATVGTNRSLYSNTDLFNLRRLNGPPDDPITYLTRLHELAGVPGIGTVPGPGFAWPDISVGAPEEIKKWYDLVTVMKWTATNDVSGGGTNWGFMDDAPNDVRQRGEFDPTINGILYTSGVDGAKMYGATGVPATTDETEYLLFKTGHDKLFADGGDDWFSRVDGPTEVYEPTTLDRYELLFDGSTGPPYIIRLKAYQAQYQLDWSQTHSNWNLTGVPKEAERIQYISITDNNVSSIASPTQTHTEDIIYKPTMIITNTGASTQTIDVQDQIVKTSIPATSAGFGNGKFDYQVTIPNFLSFTFLLWDYDGGFFYFTPP